MQQTIQQQTDIPGEWSSRPAGMDDVPALVAMINEKSQGLFGENEDTVEGWTAAWMSPGLDLQRDTRLLVDRDGKILAETELWDIAPPHVWKYAYWSVPGDCSNPAVGQWALQWAEQRARLGIELAPADARVVMSSRIPEKDSFAVDTYRTCGFDPVRRMDRMRMPLSTQTTPSSPAGVEIRPVRDDADLDSFLFVLWEAFGDHWGHVPEPYENFEKRSRSFIQNDPGLDASLCLLSLADGQPAGASLCRRDAFGEPGLGWINMLGVRRDWRKRGLGKGLLLHSFALHQSMGMRQVGLDVDSENLTGALRLYESVGLRTVRSAVTFLKELRPGKDLTVQHLDNTTS